MNADNRWYSVLDDIEAHLQAQEAAFEAGQAGRIVAFPLPNGLGAVPPNLVPRLTALRDRTDELMHRVEARKQEINRRLAALPPKRPATRPVACYIDASG